MKAKGKITIRPAKWEDVEFLRNLNNRAFEAGIEGMGRWDDEWQSERFREAFIPDGRFIIGYDGKDAGSLHLEENENHFQLSFIALLPEYQKKGIGTRVLTNLLREAAEEGKGVRLRVLRGNPAQRLYRRLGFQVTETTDTHVAMMAIIPSS